jgi:hypothetical protein
MKRAQHPFWSPVISPFLGKWSILIRLGLTVSRILGITVSPQLQKAVPADSGEALREVNRAHADFLAVSQDFRELVMNGVMGLSEADFHQRCSGILVLHQLALTRYTAALRRLHFSLAR